MQVLRLITQLSLYKENCENIMTSGSLQAVSAIIGGILDDGESVYTVVHSTLRLWLHG